MLSKHVSTLGWKEVKLSILLLEHVCRKHLSGPKYCQMSTLGVSGCVRQVCRIYNLFHVRLLHLQVARNAAADQCSSLAKSAGLPTSHLGRPREGSGADGLPIHKAPGPNSNYKDPFNHCDCLKISDTLISTRFCVYLYKIFKLYLDMLWLPKQP